MRVSVALLAEHAIGQDDGKLYVLGGGQDVLLTNSFPFVQPNLALALKLLFPTAECDSPHTVEIRAVTQEGKEFLPLFVFSIYPRANPEQSRVPVAFPF